MVIAFDQVSFDLLNAGRRGPGRQVGSISAKGFQHMRTSSSRRLEHCDHKTPGTIASNAGAAYRPDLKPACGSGLIIET